MLYGLKLTVLCVTMLGLLMNLMKHSSFTPPRCFSIHSPCVISLFEQKEKPRPRFMFFNMWVEHEDFCRIVNENWSTFVHGTKQYILCRKLKLLKKELKELNRRYFAHISVKAENARVVLKRTQIELHDRPLDDNLKAKVRDLQLKTIFLIDAERKFFAQKTKFNFLLQGDKSTKLFHSLVKRNAKRNFIASLTREDGTSTKNSNEMHEELLSFYGKLLGEYYETIKIQVYYVYHLSFYPNTFLHLD
ncbi:hypothetical protein M9H77_30473 [Catharanthus roseus]|uniref:Uncharacterized protein n=1 Tax=Catharanthus roseus TaxID=4058 RepID=A0ACB9ZY94_CATRO|nr:hypothetical protein M9H77_30473 [Catharanthus roseus]